MSNELTEADYAAIAVRLTDPATELAKPVRVLTGVQAAASGRELLVNMYGSIDAAEAEIHRGRRKTGDTRHGDSPVVRGRISEHDFTAFKQLKASTGKTQAELVREGIKLLLERHQRA